MKIEINTEMDMDMDMDINMNMNMNMDIENDYNDITHDLIELTINETEKQTNFEFINKDILEYINVIFSQDKSVKSNIIYHLNIIDQCQQMIENKDMRIKYTVYKEKQYYENKTIFRTNNSILKELENLDVWIKFRDSALEKITSVFIKNWKKRMIEQREKQNKFNNVYF